MEVYDEKLLDMVNTYREFLTDGEAEELKTLEEVDDQMVIDVFLGSNYVGEEIRDYFFSSGVEKIEIVREEG